MEIMELAQQIGALIKESPEMKRLNDAEAAYEGAVELRKLIDEYNAQDSALAENTDVAFVEAIQERMNILYEKVVNDPIYIEYVAAQQEVSKLMHKVNDEINFVITGKRSCSGSCEGCAGCH